MQANNQNQLSLEKNSIQDLQSFLCAQTPKEDSQQLENEQASSSNSQSCQNEQDAQNQKLSKQNTCWSKEEDHYLLEKVESKLGRNQKISWKSLANQLNQQFHNSIAVRDRLKARQRFYNCLDPQLKKGNWTEVEDYLIVLKKSQGMQWCKIKSYIQGRNDHQVKNRFYFLLKQFSNNNQYCSKIFKSQLQINDFQQYVQTYLKSEQNDKLNQILKQVEKRKNQTKVSETVTQTQTQQLPEIIQDQQFQVQYFQDQFKGQQLQDLQYHQQVSQDPKIPNFAQYDGQFKQMVALKSTENAPAPQIQSIGFQLPSFHIFQSQSNLNSKMGDLSQVSQSESSQRCFLPNFLNIKETL